MTNAAHRLKTTSGEDVSVALERNAEGRIVSASVGDATSRVEVVGVPTDGLLRIDGRQHPYSTIRTKDRIEVWVAGRTYSFTVQPTGPRRAGDAASAGVKDVVTAPMPGRVLAVRATVGQTFAAHDPLVVLESMKMELSLAAPHAGVVREVLCSEGETVELGAALVRISRLDDEDPA